MSRSAGQPCAGPMMWMAGEQPEVQVRGAAQGLTVNVRPSLLPICV